MVPGLKEGATIIDLQDPITDAKCEGPIRGQLVVIGMLQLVFY